MIPCEMTIAARPWKKYSIRFDPRGLRAQLVDFVAKVVGRWPAEQVPLIGEQLQPCAALDLGLHGQLVEPIQERGAVVLLTEENYGCHRPRVTRRLAKLRTASRCPPVDSRGPQVKVFAVCLPADK